MTLARANIWFVLLASLMVIVTIQGASAVVESVPPYDGFAYETVPEGLMFVVNYPVSILTVTRASGVDATTAYLYNATSGSLLGSATFVGDNATFTNVSVVPGESYYVVADSEGAGYNSAWAYFSLPITGTYVNFTGYAYYAGGWFTGTTAGYNIQSLTVELTPSLMDSYSLGTHTDNFYEYSAPYLDLCQQYIPSQNFTLRSYAPMIYNTATRYDNQQVTVRDDAGDIPGNTLATSEWVSESIMPVTPSDYVSFTFNESQAVVLFAGSTYWMCLARDTGASTVNASWWVYDWPVSKVYFWSGSVWANSNAFQGNFEVYGDAYIPPVLNVSCSVCNATCSPCGGGCTATDLNSMYYNVSTFDQTIGDITGWNTSCVTNMAYMFTDSDFNQDISGWDTSQVTDMNTMFSGTPFNQPIGSWDVSNVQDMSSMFENAGTFNQDLSGWTIGCVATMQSMFSGASLFNQPIGGWNMSCVGAIDYMFSNDVEFNQDLSSWNTAAVTSMNSVFAGASSFNQPIGSWDTSGVGQMSFMFSGASSFDQDLSGWNIQNVAGMDDMFSGSGLSTVNYDLLLNSWGGQAIDYSVQPSVQFGAGSVQYTSSAVVNRSYLIDNYGWNITDGGQIDYSVPPNPQNLTMVSAYIVPTNPLDNETMGLWCNATDSYGGVLTYNYTVFYNNTLNQSGVSASFQSGVDANILNISSPLWGSWNFTCQAVVDVNTSDVLSSALYTVNSVIPVVPPLVTDNLAVFYSLNQSEATIGNYNLTLYDDGSTSTFPSVYTQSNRTGMYFNKGAGLGYQRADTNYQIPDGSSYTVSFWVYGKNVVTNSWNSMVVDQRDSDNSGIGIRLYGDGFSGGNSMLYSIFNPSYPQAYMSDSSKNYADNNWHHVLVTYDNATQNMTYTHDNTLIATTSVTYPVIHYKSLCIDGYFDCTSLTNAPLGLDAVYSDLAVWTVALDDSSKAHVFNRDVAPFNYSYVAPTPPRPTTSPVPNVTLPTNNEVVHGTNVNVTLGSRETYERINVYVGASHVVVNDVTSSTLVFTVAVPVGDVNVTVSGDDVDGLGNVSSVVIPLKVSNLGVVTGMAASKSTYWVQNESVPVSFQYSGSGYVTPAVYIVMKNGSEVLQVKNATVTGGPTYTASATFSPQFSQLGLTFEGIVNDTLFQYAETSSAVDVSDMYQPYVVYPLSSVTKSGQFDVVVTKASNGLAAATYTVESNQSGSWVVMNASAPVDGLSGVNSEKYWAWAGSVCAAYLGAGPTYYFNLSEPLFVRQLFTSNIQDSNPRPMVYVEIDGVRYDIDNVNLNGNKGVVEINRVLSKGQHSYFGYSQAYCSNANSFVPSSDPYWTWTTFDGIGGIFGIAGVNYTTLDRVNVTVDPGVGDANFSMRLSATDGYVTSAYDISGPVEFVCTPDWSCSVYDSCPVGLGVCTAVTDANSCGKTYTGDYSEFTPLNCSVSLGVSCDPIVYPNELDLPGAAVIGFNVTVTSAYNLSSPSLVATLGGVWIVCDAQSGYYNCSKTKHYYDPAGLFSVSANLTDGLVNASVLAPDVCEYGFLLASSRMTNVVSFPGAAPGVANVVSNVPVVMKNTGNVPLNLSMTAYDLVGQSQPSIKLLSSTFKAGASLGSSVQMVNGVSTPLNQVVNPGNGAQSSTYLWLSMPVNQLVQSYTTVTPWQITATG